MLNMPKSVTISLAIPAELKEAIEKVAEKEERSLSWIVRKAIQEYLEKYKGE
jgi:predicted transcriptional regulator